MSADYTDEDLRLARERLGYGPAAGLNARAEISIGDLAAFRAEARPPADKVWFGEAFAQGRATGSSEEREACERIFLEWHKYIWPGCPDESREHDVEEFNRRLRERAK